MYKVFMDNGVIEFVKELKNNSSNEPCLVFHSQKDQLNQVLEKIDFREPKSCVRILCDDFDKAIHEVFHGYEFIDAAGGIVKRKDNYLFIERHHVWDIPKGKVEKNEKPWEAAVREIEEECGISGPTIDHFIGITYHTYLYKNRPTIKRNWWYALNYSGPKKLEPQTEESITQAIWIEKEQWSMIRKNTYHSISEVLDMAENW